MSDLERIFCNIGEDSGEEKSYTDFLHEIYRQPTFIEPKENDKEFILKNRYQEFRNDNLMNLSRDIFNSDNKYHVYVTESGKLITNKLIRDIVDKKILIEDLELIDDIKDLRSADVDYLGEAEITSNEDTPKELKMINGVFLDTAIIDDSFENYVTRLNYLPNADEYGVIRSTLRDYDLSNESKPNQDYISY